MLTRLLPYTHTAKDINKLRGDRDSTHTHRKNGGAKLWVTLHLHSLCVLLFLLTWWGRPTVWCVRQWYREHHTLRFWSGLIMEPPPRSPANPHPVTCRGKRSVQVTSQPSRQVTHDYLYLHKQTNMAARTLRPHVSNPHLHTGLEIMCL